MHGETLLTVPIKAKLTWIEEFIIKTLKPYGIIAGGFPAYLYNPDKKYSDIDFFIPSVLLYDNCWYESRAVLYKVINDALPVGYTTYPSTPRESHYNNKLITTQFKIYDFKQKLATIMQTIQKKTGEEFTITELLDSFDFNVAKAIVKNESSLFVTEGFCRDMQANVICAPRNLKPHDHGDTGFRIYKYVVNKGYSISFTDLMIYFNSVTDKLSFTHQLVDTDNVEVNKFLNFVSLMKQKDPEWNKEF